MKRFSTTDTLTQIGIILMTLVLLYLFTHGNIAISQDVTQPGEQGAITTTLRLKQVFW